MPPFRPLRPSALRPTGKLPNWGLTQRGNPTDFPVPPPPPMQRVTKGWWVLHRQPAPTEALARDENDPTA